MRVLLKDRTNGAFSPLGSATLSEGVMPSDLLRLAQEGFLHIQVEPSKEDLAGIEAGIKADEARVEAAAKAAAKQHAEETKLPEGKLVLEDLTGKQLKALCEQRGLPTQGNKFDLIDRLEKTPAEDEEDRPKKAKK